MDKGERKLIAAPREGDREAFDVLFERYGGRVYAFAYQLCGNRSDAEDLVQDAFVGAFSGMPRFQSDSTFLTWLFGIAIRRRRDKARRREPNEQMIETGQGRDLCDETIASISLQAALATLPEPMRAAFLLVASQGLTHREAAEALGEPLGTVKWRVAEAIRRLRAALTDEDENHAFEERIGSRLP